MEKGDTKRKIIIFGMGVQGKKALEELMGTYEVICFVDNNSELDGTMYKGIPIIGADKLLQYYAEDVIVIIATIYHAEVAKQLESMGITAYKIMLDGHMYNSNSHKFQRCSRCVMSNESDKYICFDDKGICNYCTTAFNNIGKIYYLGEEGNKKLERLLMKVKEENRENMYDCIMGISGGLDSSYLAYLGYKWGLRVLAVHVDDGYDTEISKANIKRLISATGFDYEVITLDKDQFNDLTVAYMKAGVPNIAIPQDNVLFAFLYKKMREYGIKYFFSGGNFALECILQRGNTYSAWDVDNILNIHKRFGTKAIDKLEFISREQMKIDEEKLQIQSPRPLDYIEYNRERAFEELKEFCGFEYYGSKHLENTLTAFIQLYWFPKKFGVDKRSSHLSSMIVSGQISRETAIRKLSEPICDDKTINRIIKQMMTQLQLSEEVLNELVEAPKHQHEEYNRELNG